MSMHPVLTDAEVAKNRVCELLYDALRDTERHISHLARSASSDQQGILMAKPSERMDGTVSSAK